MDKVKEYENSSLECEQFAVSAASSSIRAQYLQLAEMWKRLAEERRTFLQSRMGNEPS